jgi:hypothetical protein
MSVFVGVSLIQKHWHLIAMTSTSQTWVISCHTYFVIGHCIRYNSKSLIIVHQLMGATLHTQYTRTSQLYLVYTLLTFDLQQYFKTSKQFPYSVTSSKEEPSAYPLLSISNRSFTEYTHATNSDNLFSQKSKTVNSFLLVVLSATTSNEC